MLVPCPDRERHQAAAIDRHCLRCQDVEAFQVLADVLTTGRSATPADGWPLVPYSRGHIVERDGSRCRYCGRLVVRVKGGIGPTVLTFDHVFPRSRGGDSSFDNLVVACQPCNTRKADRTPDEAGMSLLPLAGDRRHAAAS